MSSLQNILKQKVKEGELWERLDEKRIRCYACGHCCPIPEGRWGSAGSVSTGVAS